MVAMGGIGSSWGYLSPTNIAALVTAAMSVRERQISAIQKQVDNFKVLQGILTDLDTKLSSLDTLAEQLAGLDSAYTFGAAKSVSVGDTTILTATATDSAAAGSYSLEVSGLAKAHSIRGKSFGQIAEDLGLAGTFYLGGKATKQATAAVTDTSITAFGTADVASGLTQLGSGDYSVEFRQNEGVWQFRLVDAEGVAVAIKYGDGTTGTTSSWQSYSAVDGTVFDTGRGLTVSFAEEPAGTPAGSKFVGGATTPKVGYVAQGAAIAVEATDSLADIKSKINVATYAAGNQVQASIVDNSLMLMAALPGTSHAIVGDGAILESLELLENDAGTWRVWDDAEGSHELQAASNASIIVNGLMTVTRSRNTGLTNVIEGVTFNALKLGTTNLAVSTNLSAADAKVREFVSKFNDALGYLRAKTGLTEKSAGSTTANATYTRGALAGDSVFMTLRSSLLQKVTQRFGHGTLEDLGIEINKNTLQLTVADASKLSDALANDMADTTELLKEIAGAVNTLLEPYVESDTNSVLELRKAQVGESINNFGERMKLQRGRIERESERLREHYYNLQQQYMLSLQQQQEWSAMASSTSSLWNALG